MRKTMSAAARKRISDGMKRRYAKLRQAVASSKRVKVPKTVETLPTRFPGEADYFVVVSPTRKTGLLINMELETVREVRVIRFEE